jgi:pimeloyl-ACP methyl ester carboxylesterase
MSPVNAGATDETSLPTQVRPATPSQGSARPFELPNEIRVDGVPIRYAVSGTGNRDLLLVHGYRAHHMWWYRLLPALEERWRVIRLDLSGHGDSGHRDHYSTTAWTAELMAVLDDAGSRHAVAVGHSMGGRVAVVAGATHPDRFGGVVTLDSYLRPPGGPPPRPAPPRHDRELVVYASRETAVERMRLQPPQPEPPAEVVRPVAEYGVRPATGGQGWTWKFDQGAAVPADNDRVVASVARLRIPMWFVRAGRSNVVTDEVAAYARGVLPTGSTFVTLPDAHHHFILDAPEEGLRLLGDLHGDLAAAVRPRSP